MIQNMKQAFQMFVKTKNNAHNQNNTTGGLESLGTKDKSQAIQLLKARNPMHRIEKRMGREFCNPPAIRPYRWLLLFATILMATCAQALGNNPSKIDAPQLVPLPRSLHQRSGRVVLGNRIVPESPELLPLGAVIAGEVEQLTGRRLTVERRWARTGDIVLRIDPSLKGESYRIEVSRTARVIGGNYAAVAEGTASLLQALTLDGGNPGWPRLKIDDAPGSGYRGLMVDAARSWHSPAMLKQLVELCRWYKVRHLQIHFTDDGAHTFPSAAYPQLNANRRHYTTGELRQLESFAVERGVVILPELDVPGHASVLVQQMPEIFANHPQSGNVICPGREETYQALNRLIGEMTDIFHTTPYFHVGADEVNLEPWKSCTNCQAYMAAHQLENVEELYRHFIVRMDQLVRDYGKKTIVWEGFHKEGRTQIPRDVTVMVFESSYNIAPDVLELGYPVINASWQPLYVVNDRNWSPEQIYGWNKYRWESCWPNSKAYQHPITVAPTALMLGAQMCTWEQSEQRELPSLRERLPAMSERLWNPETPHGYPDFAARLKWTDAGLKKLLQEPLPSTPPRDSKNHPTAADAPTLDECCPKQSVPAGE